MRCSWVECPEEGMIEQKGRDGTTWSTLCPGHAKELDEAIGSGDVKRLMRSYVKAKGGAKAAAVAAVVDALKRP